MAELNMLESRTSHLRNRNSVSLLSGKRNPLVHPGDLARILDLHRLLHHPVFLPGDAG